MMSNANSARRSESGLARFSLFDRETAVRQLLGDGPPQRTLVLDEEQMFRRISHLQGANILTQSRSNPESRLRR